MENQETNSVNPVIDINKRNLELCLIISTTMTLAGLITVFPIRMYVGMVGAFSMCSNFTKALESSFKFMLDSFPYVVLISLGIMWVTCILKNKYIVLFFGLLPIIYILLSFLYVFRVCLF